jgi:hypothetical protein
VFIDLIHCRKPWLYGASGATSLFRLRSGCLAYSRPLPCYKRCRPNNASENAPQMASYFALVTRDHRRESRPPSSAPLHVQLPTNFRSPACKTYSPSSLFITQTLVGQTGQFQCHNPTVFTPKLMRPSCPRTWFIKIQEWTPMRLSGRIVPQLRDC